RFARRMALISPEALAHTKLAINRGADAMGFLNAMHAGLDVVAPLYAAKTDVGVKFTEIRQKEGLRAALKWRRDQLAQYEDRRLGVPRGGRGRVSLPPIHFLLAMASLQAGPIGTGCQASSI